MTFNGEMALILRNFTEFGNGPYFTEFMYDVVVKQLLLGISLFQNLLLIVYDHINNISAVILRLFRQQTDNSV